MKKVLTLTSLALVSGSSMAAGPDFSAMVSGIDFSTAITAVLSVAAALAGLYIAIAGAKGVLRMIRG